MQNRNHPHSKLKAFIQDEKRRIRKLSNEQLVAYIIHNKMGAVPQGRAKQMQHILNYAVVRFKETWQEINGWAFDDCYDPVKYKQHLLTLARVKLAAEQAQKEREVANG